MRIEYEGGQNLLKLSSYIKKYLPHLYEKVDDSYTVKFGFEDNGNAPAIIVNNLYFSVIVSETEFLRYREGILAGVKEYQDDMQLVENSPLNNKQVIITIRPSLQR
jgi:hypothetical protein